VDLPKTILSLAVAPVPKQMQGHIFLGPDTEPEPSNVYLYRDRQTERFDFSRATTDGRWYYIRHFMPHRPEGRDTRYGNQVQANWRAWEAHYEAGKCNPLQSRFYQPKPPVQLFNTQSDPWHVTNLADQPEHSERVRQMSRQVDNWMIGIRDTGLIPESMFYDLVGPQKEFKTIYEYAQSSRYPVQELLEAAKEASLGDPEKQDRCLKGMRDANPIARYWGAYGIFLIRPKDEPVQNALRDMISQDPLAANRLMAAQALGLCGDPEAAFKAIFKEALDTEHGYVFLQAINAFQYSHSDDRLTKDHWEMFQKKPVPTTGLDQSGFEYARRIIDDSLALWPNRRIVD
jgi:hypothetical protein